jgi:hypothetical protein
MRSLCRRGRQNFRKGGDQDTGRRQKVLSANAVNGREGQPRRDAPLCRTHPPTSKSKPSRGSRIPDDLERTTAYVAHEYNRVYHVVLGTAVLRDVLQSYQCAESESAGVLLCFWAKRL